MSVVSVPKKYGEGDVERLRVVNDYNKNMGGVDKNDMMINNYSCVRKTYKWTNKMFFHFFEEAVFNTFVIQKKKGSTKRFLDHKLELIRAILDETEVEKIDELVQSLPKY